jgi:hypothetical protein
MDLYIHSPIRLHTVALNYLNTVTSSTLPSEHPPLPLPNEYPGLPLQVLLGYYHLGGLIASQSADRPGALLHTYVTYACRSLLMKLSESLLHGGDRERAGRRTEKTEGQELDMNNEA